MAMKDLSKTFSELESDDISLETSVPTDITFSPSSDDLLTNRRSQPPKSVVTKQLLDKKQLLHDLQMLKVELSQKVLQLENQKSLFDQNTEEMEEKLNDALHDKQMLQVRLESEIQIQREDSAHKTQLIRRELEDLTFKQKHLEETNKQLVSRSDNVRCDIQDLALKEDEFYQLASYNETDLSLRDYIRVQLYRHIHPLENEILDLKLRNNALEEDSKNLANRILSQQEDLINEKQLHAEVREKYQKLLLNFADLKQKVKVGEYKVENFDRVKGDCDYHERNHSDLASQIVNLQSSYNLLQDERDDLAKQLSSQKQSVVLLQQDKEYLSRQLSDSQNRSSHDNEKVNQIARHLEEARHSREEMYEKYIVTRDQAKNEYEAKLKDELENIKLRTSSEIDRLRTTSHEMYERENRNLRESRDMAISEKERAQKAEKDLAIKYDQLLAEYREHQSNVDNHVSDANSQLKLKSFECDRTQMVYEEMVTKNKEALLEVEKLQAKFEVLTKEYYTMQTSYEKKVAELEGKASENTIKLQSYEKLEDELDNVVLQAAEVEIDDEAAAEKVLFSYGYGANVPSNAKRRMKQSVQLAQRVLHLERLNGTLQKEIDTEKSRTELLTKDLQQANDLLGHSQQPYNYLINTIRLKDEEIVQRTDSTTNLQTKIEQLEDENKDLRKTKQQMSNDIEQLLNQKEEIASMRQYIVNMKSASNQDVSDKHSSSQQPQPTVFTREHKNTKKASSGKPKHT